MPSYKYTEPSWVRDSIAADITGRLSSKDRTSLNKMKAAVKLTPEEEAESIRQDRTPANLMELNLAITNATDPVIRQILQAEQTRILGTEVEQFRAQAPASNSLLNSILTIFSR